MKVILTAKEANGLVGEELRREIMKRYPSLVAFATDMGISDSSLSHLLNNKRRITRRFIDRAAKILGLAENHIMGLHQLGAKADGWRL